MEVDNAESIIASSSKLDSQNQEDEDNFGNLDAEPGAIIFSPQDLLSTIKDHQPKRPHSKTKSMKSKIELKDPKAFPCDICNTALSSEKSLIQHMSIHLGVKPFQCMYCDKSFTRKVHLQGHLVMHGIKKQYECPTCHQRFSRPDCVKVHMRLHDKSKCIYCEVCQKAFLTVGTLNIHMRIHRGDKPFKCHICGKCFTQKTHLITHIKRHTKVTDVKITKKLGPRMFKCVHCTKSFIRLSDYERHVQWNHGAIADYSYKDQPVAQQDYEEEKYQSPKDILCRNKKKERKPVTCTTSTQTDESGGHIIIPRKYQNQGTSMYVPSTPKHEEDAYENEMFDEGMDRNYSSDEEEEESTSVLPSIMSVSTSSAAVNSVQDAAFDAVIKGGSIEARAPAKKFKPNSPVQSKSDLTTRVPTVQPSRAFDDDLNYASNPISRHSNSNAAQAYSVPKPRGRPKGSVKKEVGFKGATELRLIRKSMMTFISEEAEAESKKQKDNEEIEEQAITVTEQADGGAVASLGTIEDGDGRKRRVNRTKQHGRDFVCTMKGCEVCNPAKEKSDEAPIVVKVEKTSPLKLDKTQEIKTEVQQSSNQSQQDTTKTKLDTNTTTKRILNIYNNLAYGHRYGSDKQESRNSRNLRRADDEYFAPEESPNNIISPPVEVHSFCIPTYSCKLCGKEFRFEGKLHRHIESVHQNKEIFSADVKPGKGSMKTSKINYPCEYIIPDNMAAFSNEDENPEIAALRSEWSDDDEEQNNTNQEKSAIVNQQAKIDKMIRVINADSKSSNVPATPIEDVKMIFNRITGILPDKSRSRSMQPPEPVFKPDKTLTLSSTQEVVCSLDVKCHKLLEKLFDNELLLNSGLNEDHVSVVLGRILQHYGVKMIEDYGQGQYEVLKYNMWRLIEWKVTMEQMEEFYRENKSVEEMMDDIMNNRVPLVSHNIQVERKDNAPGTPATTASSYEVNPVTSVDIGSGNQVVLSQVAANVLGEQLNLGDGVTQVVLAQDLSPEMLQGAHIVTIDPTTGQVLSQVTADQVILADTVGEMNSQVVELSTRSEISQAAINVSEGCETTFSNGSIIQNNCPTSSVTQPIMSQVILSNGQTNLKLANSNAQQH